jgi:hemolysin activation/secretion protein
LQPRRAAAAVAATLLLSALPMGATQAADQGEPAARPRTLEINEYRLEGVAHLTQLEAEAVVAPFLGPGRLFDDVEKARAALELAYSDKGYQAVTVAIPPQKVREGVVTLKVTEGTVGRLRVRGAHWFLLSEIAREAPSLAEGIVPNFNDLLRDVVVLNQLPDRRITPALRAGAVPGTVDVDLNVVDVLPLHGSLELNNRNSGETTALRLNGSLRYDNLWQQGHSLSFTFQVAPKRVADAKIFSLGYQARFLQVPWLSVSVNAVNQDSDISTLGGTAVQGRGRTVGTRVAFTLPGPTDLFHAVTVGLDSKRYGKELATDPYSLPIGYAPVSLQYLAALSSDSSQTNLTATVTFNLRALSSGEEAFDAKRYGASASFLDLRTEASRTQSLVWDLQLFGRVLGFIGSGPLIPSEQVTAGGAESVRGYYEGQVAGDKGVVASGELRSPSAAPWIGSWLGEWRLHLFADHARVVLLDPLPEQQSTFQLWSAGAGTRIRAGPFYGVLEAGVPMRSQGTIRRHDWRYLFRLSGEF